MDCKEKNHSSVAVIVACAAIGVDRTKNTIPLLLFTGHYLAMAVVYLFTSW
jgi:hypothetical protein